jgi:hypothetical protein
LETRWPISAVLAVLLSAQLLDEAIAQTLTPYWESSGTGVKPRSNAGLAVQTDRLKMRADFALRAQQSATTSVGPTLPGGRTEVVPNLRSALTIAKNLDIETRVNFAEWNARSATTVDTRVRYRRSLDLFFDELDGSLWRSPDGLTKQSLRLGFEQILGDFGSLSPLTITGQATFETTQDGAATGLASDSRKIGVETRLAGFTSPFLAADHALIFKAERTSGARPASASAVTYDQSWTVSPMTKLGVNLQFLRQSYRPTNGFEPSIDVSWRSQF